MSVRDNVRDSIEQHTPALPISTWWSLAAGGIGGLATFFIYFGLQRIFQHLPTYELIGAMQGSTTTFCFAGITAASTILPLMLTIFSFARSADVDFSRDFYQRIKNIGLLCCGAFLCGLFTLAILSAPIGDMQEVSNTWYTVFYFLIVFGLVGMTAQLVMILLMLYSAIVYLVNVLSPAIDHSGSVL